MNGVKLGAPAATLRRDKETRGQRFGFNVQGKGKERTSGPRLAASLMHSASLVRFHPGLSRASIIATFSSSCNHRDYTESEYSHSNIQRWLVSTRGSACEMLQHKDRCTPPLRHRRYDVTVKKLCQESGTTVQAEILLDFSEPRFGVLIHDLKLYHSA